MQTAYHELLPNGNKMPYLLYLPDDYDHDTSKRWPFILFLHGSGERGDDPNIIRLHGLPRQIDTQPDFPAIVLSPQCPMDVRWPTQDANIIALLDAVLPTLRIDPQRIYLSGLSMGGEGTWYFGSRYPERFAAALPICGRIPEVDGFPESVCALKDIPIWAFHGAKDDRVSVEHSERMVKILKDCGGKVQLTIFPEADHFCWDQVYEDAATWDWLLGQQK